MHGTKKTPYTISKSEIMSFCFKMCHLLPFGQKSFNIIKDNTKSKRIDEKKATLKFIILFQMQ